MFTDGEVCTCGCDLPAKVVIRDIQHSMLLNEDQAEALFYEAQAERAKAAL